MKKILSVVTSKNDNRIALVYKGKAKWGVEGYTYMLLSEITVGGDRTLNAIEFLTKEGWDARVSKTLKGAERAAKNRLH